MNNKGQSLVTFVLLIPLILLVLFMVYDIGSMVLLKIELNNVEISVVDNKLNIILEDTLDNKISLIRKFKIKIKSSYVGYMEDGKKKIVKG